MVVSDLVLPFPITSSALSSLHRPRDLCNALSAQRGLPVGRVFGGDVGIVDDQQVLGVALVGLLREVERTGKDRALLVPNRSGLLTALL
jgi:hypothetical protein